MSSMRSWRHLVVGVAVGALAVAIAAISPDPAIPVSTTVVAVPVLSGIPGEVPVSGPQGAVARPVAVESGSVEPAAGRSSAAGAYVVVAGGADLVPRPGGVPFVRAREGLVLAGRHLDVTGEWLRVFHMCDGSAWVPVDGVRRLAPVPTTPTGPGFDLGEAVVVVDPGHGGANIGAESLGGRVEKHVNLDIAQRLRRLLEAPQAVDWATGKLGSGEEVAPVGAVIMTRTADDETGLDFRAVLAGVAGAHAMVSIHNNAGWEIETDGPGSEAYYQSQPQVREASQRLATLVVEELRRSFSEFDANWVGARALGAKSRLSPRDEVSQYYGLLRTSRVPTVIAEGAYIANPSEGELLETEAFRQAYAEAMYRALVRFLTTDEPGDAPLHAPVVWHGSAGRGGASSDCSVPAQPS